MVSKKGHKRTAKAQTFLQLAILAVGLIILNLLASQYYQRFDLTKEKRFTLSETTENLVKELDTKLTFNVYLDGELSPKFKQLKNSLRDLLQEIGSISEGKIQFTFSNPLEGKTDKEQEDIIKQLESKGLVPHYDQESDAAQSTVSRLFPGAEVLDGGGNSYVLNFLTTKLGRAEETAINSSIENLEYELANLIRKAGSVRKNRKIGFLQGHGELGKAETADIRKELTAYYTVRDVFLNFNLKETLLPIQSKIEDSENKEQAIFKELLDYLKDFKGLVMAKPTRPFSKAEAFILDQYIMNGGKVMFMIDPIFAEYDSLSKYEKMLASNYELGELQNMLYIYGIRLNSSMLMDLRCNDIVLQSPNGLLRNFAWTYYPIFTDNGDHPIAKNIEAVWGRFVSTVKPMPRDNLSHIPLLRSSEKSRTSNSPLMLDLGIITQNKNPKFLASFNKGEQVCGVLSEGNFQSIFKGRNTSSFTGIDFKDHIDNNSIIIIADGDIAKNQVHKQGEGYFELGYDLTTKRNFGNKKFVTNCIDYLCDNSGLIDIRNKEYQLRLLDQNKVKNSKVKWQFINIIAPILLIILFGLINAVIRKYKYAK